MDEIEGDECSRPVTDFHVESEYLRLGPAGIEVFFSIAAK